MSPTMSNWLPAVEMNVVVLYAVSCAKQLASNWIRNGQGLGHRSRGAQGAAAAGLAPATIARTPRTAATPRIRFMRGPPLSRYFYRGRSGLAVKGLDRAPRLVSGRRLARNPALAIHLVIVAQRNRPVGWAEQTSEHPARALGDRDVGQIGTAVESHVPGEASL